MRYLLSRSQEFLSLRVLFRDSCNFLKCFLNFCKLEDLFSFWVLTFEICFEVSLLSVSVINSIGKLIIQNQIFLINLLVKSIFWFLHDLLQASGINDAAVVIMFLLLILAFLIHSLHGQLLSRLRKVSLTGTSFLLFK